MASYLPLPPQFSSSDDWCVYEARINQFFLAYEIVDEKRKAAIVLTAISNETFKTLTNLCFPQGPEKKSYKEICSILKKQFSPVFSVYVERVKFYESEQGVLETINEWFARLKSLSVNCEFGDYLSNVLRDKFICGLQKGTIFASVCELEKDATIEQCVSKALKTELALQQRVVENNSISHAKSKQKTSLKNTLAKRTSDKVILCFACGKSDHDFKACKYKKYKCKLCKTTGHLAAVCKQKSVGSTRNYCLIEEKGCTNYALNDHGVCKDANDSRSDRGIYKIEQFNNIEKSDSFKIDLNINGVTVNFEIDTGSAVSVCSERFYKQHFKDSKLKVVDTILKTYDGKTIKPIGVFKANVMYKSKLLECNILVIKNGGQPLIGRDILKILDINFINSFDVFPAESEVKDLLIKYKELFNDELGHYKFEKIKLELVDNDVKPMFCKPRPVPIAFQELVNKQIDRDVQNGLLRKVEHSEWGSPLVPVLKKDGSLRLCADYKVTINKHLKDFNYPLPRIEDLFAALEGGKQFTKLDIRNAYNQLELEESSQKLLSWSTHRGLFAPTRLTFGTKPACALFQSIMEKTLQGCTGVVCFLDDILVTGSTKEQHKRNLEMTFKKLLDAGFRLKSEKCEFYKEKVSYLGYIIDAEGLHKDPAKVLAISDAKPPTDVTQIKAFVGLVGYYSRFIPNMAQVLSPIYKLLQKDRKFIWDEQCQESFDSIKKIIVSNKVLTHYDRNAPVKLMCDASTDGIGAAIFHVTGNGEKPIAFASRVLQPAERNYSTTDREALAIYFGVNKFAHYLLGRHFILTTDHRPLIAIFGSKKGIPAMAAGRLQRWSIYLSNFNFDIEYVEGKKNVNADFLSRFPLEQDVSTITEDVSYLNFMSDNIEQFITKNDIRRESQADITISKVIDGVKYGWNAEMKSKKEFQPFIQKSEQLSIEEGILMWGYRVIIPITLRKALLQALHSTHMGVVKMKARARSYFWWPLMDSEIENLSRNCESCLVNRPEEPKGPISPWPLESRPYNRVHVDFLGPFRQSTFMVVIDSFTKWVEVYKMESITAKETVSKLRDCFARFGLPDTIVSDNGCQFTSAEYQTFCARNGIKVMHSPPYKPQSNGAAENAVKTFKNGLKKMLMDPINKYTPLDTLISRHLFFYRSTTHCSSGETPAKLMFGRELITNFDRLKPNLLSEIEKKLDERIAKENRSVRKNFEPGEEIAFRTYGKHSKSWSKGVIERRIGTNVYLCRTKEDKIVKRHADQILKNSPNQRSTTQPVLIPIPTVSGRGNDPSSPIIQRRSSIGISNNTDDSCEQVKTRSGRIIRPPSRLYY